MPNFVLGAGGVAGFLEGATSSMTGEFNAALPYAGTIFALIAGVLIAVKVFKKLTGART